MVQSSQSFILLLASFASVMAHIKLQAPVPRDTSEDVELNQLSGPCGKGFDSAGSRTTVELTGFSLKLQVADDKANTVVYGAIGDNPSSFSTQLATTTASLQTVDIPIDFTKLGAKSGDKITIQIQETSADGKKYVCADLLIAGSATATSTASASSTTPTSSAGQPNATNSAQDKSLSSFMAAAALLFFA